MWRASLASYNETSSVLGIANRRATTSYRPGRGLCARNREFAVVQVDVSSRARRTREPTSVAVLFRPAPAAKSSESHYRTVSRCPFCESFCKAS